MTLPLDRVVGGVAITPYTLPRATYEDVLLVWGDQQLTWGDDILQWGRTVYRGEKFIRII